MFPFGCFVILFVRFCSGLRGKHRSLKMSSIFFSGTNRPLTSAARAQDIRIYENSSAHWSRERGFLSEVSKVICFELFCLNRIKQNRTYMKVYSRSNKTFLAFLDFYYIAHWQKKPFFDLD